MRYDLYSKTNRLMLKIGIIGLSFCLAWVDTLPYGC